MTIFVAIIVAVVILWALFVWKFGPKQKARAMRGPGDYRPGGQGPFG